MDLHQLFILKEELLKDLDRQIELLTFRDEEAKNDYYAASMEAIMAFFAKAMIRIIDLENEKESNKKSA